MRLITCVMLAVSFNIATSSSAITDFIQDILGEKFIMGRPHTRRPVHPNPRPHTNQHPTPTRHPHPSNHRVFTTNRPHPLNEVYTTKPPHRHHPTTRRHHASFTTRTPHIFHERTTQRPGFTGSRWRANDRGDTGLSIVGTQGTWSRYLQNRRITLSRYREVQSHIRSYLKQHPYMIPRWVQLAFHDCSGARGCDGCMDQRHAGNHGLLKTIDDANDYHKQLAPEMSRPDFYVLLGTEAAQAGANYSLNLPYKTGRRDCYLDGVTDSLPAGDDPHAFEFLMQQFGLTEIETIGLLGAHSLGGAHKVHSGFHGPWDLTPLQLDNGYYKAMRADLHWELEQLENKTSGFKSSQWTSKKLVKGKSFLMLHADMVLKYNFDCSGDYKMPNCNRTTCQTNESRYKVVNDFADSLENFYEVFSRAFTKMTSKGTFSLSAPIGADY